MKEFEIISGGGVVKVKISGLGKFFGLMFDLEFLKEDVKFVLEMIFMVI